MKTKEAKLYIFDMDGTILDSMKYWLHLGRDYVLSQGITPPENLSETIKAMTLEEAAVYFQQLGINKDVESIENEALEYIRREYRYSIPAKPGMIDYVKGLRAGGNLLCLLTTTEDACAVSALKRLGLLDCFEHVYTSDQLGMGKHTGAIYKEVCKRYNVSPAETVVYEDAPYAVKSAVEAGCYVYAMPDDYYHKDWNEIVALAQEVFEYNE